jgi:molybdenum cofactor cytidylyltransferase
MSIGILLLAAGASSRMGQSKQLLKIKGEFLLVQSVTIAKETGLHPEVVVLGAHEKEHRQAIEHLSISIAVNAAWKNGMGGSLKTGLQHLISLAPGTEAVLVMVCDQPLLTAGYLKKLVQEHQSSHALIVASRYAETGGVPALFHKSLFPEILELSDDQGAKKIIQQHPGDTCLVDFPEGSMDLDTPEDYRNFIEKH